MDRELLQSVSKSLLLVYFCVFGEKVVLFSFFREKLAKVDKIPCGNFHADKLRHELPNIGMR